MTSGAFMFNDVLFYTVNSQILKRNSACWYAPQISPYNYHQQEYMYFYQRWYEAGKLRLSYADW